MEGFGDFDESLFVENKDRKKLLKLPCYTAKPCFAKWYMFETPEDRIDQMLIYKYRAEMAYRLAHYPLAIKHYQDCVDILSVKDIGMYRDVMDGYGCCLLQLGHHQEALDAAKQLDEHAKTSDHKTSSLMLLVKVHNKMGNWMECRHCLHCLLTMHPVSPDLWSSLATLYFDIISKPQCQIENGHQEPCSHGISTAKDKDDVRKSISDEQNNKGDSSEKNLSSTSDCASLEIVHSPDGAPCCVETMKDETERMRVLALDCENKYVDTENPLLAATTCLIRARMLVNAVHRTMYGFALERNKKQLLQIDNQIKELPVSEQSLEQCRIGEVIRRIDEEILDTSLEFMRGLDDTAKTFPDKWFGWMNDMT